MYYINDEKNQSVASLKISSALTEFSEKSMPECLFNRSFGPSITILPIAEEDRFDQFTKNIEEKTMSLSIMQKIIIFTHYLFSVSRQSESNKM